MARQDQVEEVNPIRCSCGALIVDDDGYCQQGHDHNGLADHFAEQFQALTQADLQKRNQEANLFCQTCRQCQLQDLAKCPLSTKPLA